MIHSNHDQRPTTTRRATLAGMIAALTGPAAEAAGRAGAGSEVWITTLGYKGDGSDASPDRLNDVIASLSKRGGGIVRIPPNFDLVLIAPLLLASRVTLRGSGWTSRIRASRRWRASRMALVYAPRALGPYQDIAVEDLLVVGKLSGNKPGHSQQGAAILIGAASGARVRRVKVTAADDACVRLEGYAPRASGPSRGNDPDTNPDLGHLVGGLVEDCDLSGGYIGVEIEGGASAIVRRNKVHDIALHGIRLPRARDGAVYDNDVWNVGSTAVYADYANRCDIYGNRLSARPGRITVALGHVKNTKVRANRIKGGAGIADTLFVRDKRAVGKGLEVVGNELATGGVQLSYQAGVRVRDNTTPKGALRLERHTTGIVLSPHGKLLIPAMKIARGEIVIR